MLAKTPEKLFPWSAEKKSLAACLVCIVSYSILRACDVNIFNLLSHHQKTNKAYSPTVVVKVLLLFSVQKELHA